MRDYYTSVNTLTMSEVYAQKLNEICKIYNFE